MVLEVRRLKQQIVIMLVTVGFLGLPSATASPADQGVSTTAQASSEISSAIWHDHNPDDPDEGGECHFTITKEGQVYGSLTGVTYAWTLPGKSGSSVGPTTEHNIKDIKRTVAAGNYLSSQPAKATIYAKAGTLELDRATARDRSQSLECTEENTAGFSPPCTDDCVPDILCVTAPCKIEQAMGALPLP